MCKYEECDNVVFQLHVNHIDAFYVIVRQSKLFFSLLSYIKYTVW